MEAIELPVEVDPHVPVCATVGEIKCVDDAQPAARDRLGQDLLDERILCVVPMPVEPLLDGGRYVWLRGASTPAHPRWPGAEVRQTTS